MEVVIAGATGFIGQHLVPALKARGHAPVVLSRDVENARRLFDASIPCAAWDGRSAGDWERHLPGAVVVNLVGENIGARIWTRAVRKRLVDSRVAATAALTRAIADCRSKPAALIQASAVGYYGSRGAAPLDESAGKGSGFLADLTEQWEEASRPVEAGGVRRILLRTGIVLAADGGVLTRMRRPFMFFVGGTPGSGSQMISWIHMEDLIGAVEFLMARTDLNGIFNLAAPEPVAMAVFYRALGQALKRPSWLPVPAWVIGLVFGDMGRETILASQRVVPERLLAAGFVFRYREISAALDAVYRKEQ